ncbi:MAG: hypothetical protein C5S40_00950 [ANME-2 cluster archaeon]|nr:hypothetical protein [ANME-2 cluster archaeon]
MISSDVINAKFDLVDQNIHLLEELKEEGYESFSNMSKSS